MDREDNGTAAPADTVGDGDARNLVAAEMLVGRFLPNRWKVIARVSERDDATGGLFSVGYIVENEDGRRGFLKALDYSAAFRSEDPPTVLEAMTASFNFERSLLQRCGRRGLSRIVSILADGRTDVPEATGVKTVNYLILELAEGDVRRCLAASEQFDLAWKLRSLHHVATGVYQLHTLGIAHRDVKPSNVLAFGADGSKLSDLGRAMAQSHEGPNDDFQVPGDRGYAPPEFLYSYVDGNLLRRSMAGDLYLLGSLAMYFFSGVGMTAAILALLHPSLHWKTNADPYEVVLPHIRHAFNQALDQLTECVEEGCRDELTLLVRYLCDPQPELRGHPKNRVGASYPYSLERFISRLDLLARKAELRLIGSS